MRDQGGGGRRILLVLNINHCTVSSEEEDTHWQEVNQSHNAMHTEGSPSPILEHHLFSKASIWERAQKLSLIGHCCVCIMSMIHVVTIMSAFVSSLFDKLGLEIGVESRRQHSVRANTRPMT